MAEWYEKYLSIYGKPFNEVPQEIIDGTRERLAAMQSENPVASIVVIGYNEETHLQACLWAISEIKCQYPVEIIGVDNDSKDHTAEVYEKSGIPYYTEYQHSCGYARRCGLEHAKGKYYFDVDSDTLYPPMYYELMLEQLMKPGVVAVSATWSYFPDANHSKLPELSVRGLVFAYEAELGRKEGYRVDIIRGEDGSMALSLKKYGKIAFLRDRRACAITGYGTIGQQSIWSSFVQHVKIQGKGLTRIFHKTDHYEDTEDNLVKNK